MASQKRLLIASPAVVAQLKVIQKRNGNPGNRAVDSVPHAAIAGWQDWPAVMAVVRYLARTATVDPAVFCAMPSGLSEHAQAKHMAEAATAGITLHIVETTKTDMSCEFIRRLVA